MKWLFLLFALSFGLWELKAQQTDSLPPEVIRLMLKRQNALKFSRTLHKITEPSTASGFGLDQHINTNSSLQKKPFITYASVQPVINFGGKRWHIGKYIHNFQVVTNLTLRLFQNDSTFNDHSIPVRTPTYIIKGIYQASLHRFWNDSLRTKWYAALGVFHNSNGQDGYEFNPDGTINVYNGNFSEFTVWDISIGAVRETHRPLASPRLPKSNKSLRHVEALNRDGLLYWKLTYENHPRISTNGKFLRYQIYGRYRVAAQLGYFLNPLVRPLIYSSSRKTWIPEETTFKRHELRRLVANLSYILDTRYNTGSIYDLQKVGFFEVNKRLNIDLTWYERIGTTNDFALFFRVGYYGSDPYNIYFMQSLYVMKVGVAFGNFAFGEKGIN